MISIFNTLFEPFSGYLGVVLALVAILFGAISLFFGRRFYWVFVGVAGFLLGLNLGPVLFSETNTNWQPWLILIFSIIFALLSIVLNKLMIAVSGAIGLGTLVYLLTQPYFVEWASILLTIVGAIVGLLVSWFVFDWGLMVFSALAGAAIISSAVSSLVPQISSLDGVIFLALFMIGLIFQVVQWTKKQTREEISGQESVVTSEATVEETDKNQI